MPGWSPLDGFAATVYTDCVTLGSVTPAEVAARHGVPVAQVDAALATLTEAGLVHARADGRIAALPPRSAFGALAQRLENEAEDARRQGQEWQDRWGRRSDQGGYLELLVDPDDISRLELSLLDSASRVRSLSVGPVGPPEERPKPAVHDGFPTAVRNDARIQVVYGAGVFADAAALAAVEACIDLGEEVRVFAQVPFNLLIFDDRVAMTVVPGTGAARKHAVLVHRSGLLDALIDLFECFWNLGVPLAKTGTANVTDELDEDDAKLLLYLGAGLTDEAIARELAVSDRTVGRRIAHLQERLGARSRFQLAHQAARRGWI